MTPSLLDRKKPPSQETGWACFNRKLADVGRVKSDCASVWKKRGGRTDSFIGVTALETWAFYLAPCFGTKEGSEMCLACDWKDESAEIPKTEVERVYGAGNVVYVVLTAADYQTRNFDGKSHQAMGAWVNAKYGLTLNWDRDFLGWSIQQDESGTYIRFSSGRNQSKFTERVDDDDNPIVIWENVDRFKNREHRDMPKQWALWCARILARDLHLTLAERYKRIDRLDSRTGRQLTSKVFYFT